jgi:D-alanine-D-alanine ligase
MKSKVMVLCGGQSSEHEISCISAGGILEAIDREKFEPILVGITKSGDWVLPAADQILTINNGKLPEIKEGNAQSISEILEQIKPDVIFPILHGPYGEDGTVQGLFEIAGIRYVGSGVLASAVAMDKSFAKPIFAAHGLQVAHGIVLHQRDWNGSISTGALNFPLFVKPARGGSSRGTTKVKSAEHLAAAIDEAFSFDTKVMIEEAIIGREIECAVLEIDGVATASPLGEIKIDSRFEFYDFEAKYLDGSTTVLSPTDLPTDEIQTAAVKAFRAIGCEGLARVDFFYSNENGLVINEINTMPGFTSTSVFPKLWSQAGTNYKKLISTLIESALSRSSSVTR